MSSKVNKIVKEAEDKIKPIIAMKENIAKAERKIIEDKQLLKEQVKNFSSLEKTLYNEIIKAKQPDVEKE